MRTRSILFSLLLLAGLSCKKDSFNYPAGTVGISKIVYFPAIKLKGDKYLIVQQGAAFTDPGVDAILAGMPVPYTSDPTTINTSSPGIFNITYSAKNPQGNTVTASRIVVVVPNGLASDAVAMANDLSGTYLRGATGVTSTWTKLGDGVYIVENAGGAGSGIGYTVVAINYPGNTIYIPVQSSASYGGDVSSSNGLYVPGSPAMYSWILHAPNYGSGVRTFVKQ